MASASTTRSIGRGLARIEPEAGVLVAYSAKDGQVAQDGDGPSSPFAASLLKYLDEPGLEINMLFRRVITTCRPAPAGNRSPSPMALCRPKPSISSPTNNWGSALRSCLSSAAGSQA